MPYNTQRLLTQSDLGRSQRPRRATVLIACDDDNRSGAHSRRTIRIDLRIDFDLGPRESDQITHR